jgi:hypothetical protein
MFLGDGGLFVCLCLFLLPTPIGVEFYLLLLGDGISVLVLIHPSFLSGTTGIQ